MPFPISRERLRTHAWTAGAIGASLVLLIPGAFAFAPRQQFAQLGDFRLESGEIITDAVVGYRTAGQLNAARSNAVLVAPWFQGTTGQVARQIGPGKLVDTSKYFVIMVDALGNGVSSSPSTSARQAGAGVSGVHDRRHRREPVSAGDQSAPADTPSRGRWYLHGRHAGIPVDRRPSGIHGQGGIDRGLAPDTARRPAALE